LEHYALTEPYNWFNFHDFWQSGFADEPMLSVTRAEHADA
jgi:predicted LPLAT superfamily acyltransferase